MQQDRTFRDPLSLNAMSEQLDQVRPGEFDDALILAYYTFNKSVARCAIMIYINARRV
jgi:hypothetical protein